MVTQVISEAIPEGLCKETIRARAEELRTSIGDNRDPLHLQASLRQAFGESIDGGKFPEIWTYIRARTPAPWGEDDIACSLAAVEKVELLRKDLEVLTKKHNDLKAKHLKFLRSNRDMHTFERVVNAAWQMQQMKGHVNLEDLD